MARVIFLTEFFPPETFAGANRAGVMADVLSTSHKILVVTLEPSYPNASLYSLDRTAASDAQRRYPIKRAFRFSPHSRSLFVRALREQIMATRLSLSVLSEPADVVLATSPSMFLGPAAWAIARLKSIPFVWDVRDLNWEYARESTSMSAWYGLALTLLQRFMWFVARHANVVTVATPGIKSVVVGKGIDVENVIVLPNTVDEDLLVSCARCGEFVPKSRPVIAYVGLLGEAQGIGVMADIAKKLPSVDFVVVGDGPERKALDERCRRYGIRNLQLTGYLQRSEVFEVYRRSDLLFAQLRDTATLNVTGLPSKLFEYMATGKPIIYGGSGLAAETLEESGSGIAVEAENPDEIATAIKTLLANREKMREMGRNGRRYVEGGTSREQAMQELVDVLGAEAGL